MLSLKQKYALARAKPSMRSKLKQAFAAQKQPKKGKKNTRLPVKSGGSASRQTVPASARKLLPPPGPADARVIAAKAFDASDEFHFPAPFSDSRYIVIRGRKSFSLNADSSGHRVIFISAFQGTEPYTPTIAVTGQGGAAFNAAGVGQQNDSIASTAFSTYADTLASCHALAVTIRCTGASTGNIPEGFFTVSRLHNRLGSNASQSFGNYADYLMDQRDTRSCTAYNALTRAKGFACVPAEQAHYSEYGLCTNTAATDADWEMGKDMTPYAIVLRSTASMTVPYQITVYTEWRVKYSEDNPMLRSVQSRRMPTKPEIWNKVVEAARSFEPLLTSGLNCLADNAANALIGAVRGAIYAPGAEMAAGATMAI
jgi:hypothetical protein